MQSAELSVSKLELLNAGFTCLEFCILIILHLFLYMIFTMINSVFNQTTVDLELSYYFLITCYSVSLIKYQVPSAFYDIFFRKELI